MSTRLQACLMIILLAAPAVAQYRRSGLLQLAYDDFSVRTSEGTRHVSAWNQSYNYLVAGPVIHPIIGEGQATVNFSLGKSLAQATSTADSSQKVFGYSFSGSLLPPGLRRFVTLAPSFSKTETTQVWGQPQAVRNVVDTRRGLTLGLALPRLPSLSVSRSKLDRKDGSSAPVVDQETLLENEQVTYGNGPLRMQYRHDLNHVQDRLSPLSETVNDQKTTEMELNYPELNRHGLQSAFFRSSYQGQSTESRGSSLRQKSLAVNLHLATRRWLRGGWDSYLAYNNELSRNLMDRNNSFRDYLSLVSAKISPRGRLDNRLAYADSRGRTEGHNISDSMTGEWRSSSGRTAHRINADGGWGWERPSGASLTDSLRYRVTLYPRPSYDLYGELGMAGSAPLNGHPGGSRQHSLGTGTALRPTPNTDLSLNYNLSRNRDLGSGSVSMNHNLTARAQTSPLAGLSSTLIYSLSWSEDNQFAPGSNGVLNFNLSYAAARGLSLSTELTRASHSFNMSASANYSIGMTQFRVSFERQQLYTPNSYSRFSTSLSRFL